MTRKKGEGGRGSSEARPFQNDKKRGSTAVLPANTYLDHPEISPALLQVDTEKWDTVYQVVSTRGETVEIFLDDADSIANLEAVAKSGTGKRRPRVRVDLAGAEFFSMEEVASEFEAEKPVGSGASTRTQLGYGTTEEVWRRRFVVVARQKRLLLLLFSY